MKRALPAFLAVLVLLSVAWLLLRHPGCGRPPPPEKRVVAKVNDKVITLADFSARFVPFLASLSSPPRDPANLRVLKVRFLGKLAEEELLLQEASVRGLSAGEGELEGELSKVKEDLAAGASEEEAARRLAQWKADLSRKILLGALADAVTADVTVTDEEVRRYYDEHPQEFNRPPMARARQIVVGSEAEARALRTRLLAKADFPALARSSSIAPESEKGGDLGLFAQGEMPEEIDDVVFALPAGALSRVVKSPYGWHLIKVEERLPARTLTFDDARESVRQKLLQEKKTEAFARWAASFKDKAQIVLAPENLEETAVGDR